MNRTEYALIFDVDGVLVDSPHEAAWRDSWHALVSGPWHERARGYQPAAFTTAFYQQNIAGRPRLDGAAAVLAAFGVADPDGSLCQEYAEAKQARVLALIRDRQFTAFGDAIRLALRARASGMRLGVASSSRNANLLLQQIALAPYAESMRDPTISRIVATTARLDELFDANTSGIEVPHGKPAPDLFLITAEALGIAPAACSVIEDAPAGIAAARAAGMHAIGIARLDDEAALAAAGAHQVVTSLDQIDLAVPGSSA